MPGLHSGFVKPRSSPAAWRSSGLPRRASSTRRRAARSSTSTPISAIASTGMLSDVLYGFKRIMPAPLAPEEVEADVVVCTHSHPDHFDYDAIPVLARNPQIHFVAAPDCRAEFEKLGVPEERYTIIHEGETLTCGRRAPDRRLRRSRRPGARGAGRARAVRRHQGVAGG